jgi:hypothetical protein
MIRRFVALAGLMLCVSTAATAAKVPVSDATAQQGVAAASEAALRVIGWIGASGDNHSLPYVVIDKVAARAFLFDGKGKALADAPILIGIATGDDATPGIGKKSLAEIGPAEKTTPAGRFLAKFGLAAGRQSILWVDYGTSVALHTIPPGNPKDRRRERMLSLPSDDNRITFGCINVPKAFYGTNLRPQFGKKGGYVYILPDTKSLEEVFPPIRVQPFVALARPADGEGAGE